MKISLYNFKSIIELNDYEINSVNILTGKNSIGKTSLIHFLLMIKQTFEYNYDESFTQLRFNKPYVNLGRFEDIITDQDVKRDIKFSFELGVDDFLKYSKKYLVKKILNTENPRIKVEYSISKSVNGTSISYYRIDLLHKNLFFELTGEKNYYKMKTNSVSSFINSLYLDDLGSEITHIWNNDPNINVVFRSLAPAELSVKAKSSSGTERKQRIRTTRVVSYITDVLESIFNHIDYIGPLRDEPHRFYINDEAVGESVGLKGEYSVQILTRESKKKVLFNALNSTVEGGYVNKKLILINAVKYWLCDVFQMGKSIRVKVFDNQTLLKILLKNGNDKEIPITHVGFGISQILPIIVELLRDKKGILILEQPEIHLHPNAQAILFDFIYGQCLLNRSVIVETHSDHLITRMRRRVAEDSEGVMAENINLYFVEDNKSYAHYTKLNVNDYGILSHWPEGFCDRTDHDLRLLSIAQNSKRKVKGNETNRI